MKITPFSFFGFILLVSNAWAAKEPLPLIREKDPDFQVDLKQLEAGQIQYFYEMLDPEKKPLADDDLANESNGVSEGYGMLEAIDQSPDGGASRSKERLYTGVMRVAFLVDRPASSFTAEQACDARTLQDVARVAGKRIKVTPAGAPCSFSLNGSGFVPNQKFRVKYFSAESAPKNRASEALAAIDRANPNPAVTITQYNFDYGKIFFTKTAHSTSTLVNVHEIDASRSLVQTYTLYFIHKLPPKIGGGPPWVRQQIEAQLPKLREARSRPPVSREPAATSAGACISPAAQAKLVDHATTLIELEQRELTEGQCEKYRRYIDPRTEELLPEFTTFPAALEAKVLCGKWLFFNVSAYSKLGIPNGLFRSLEQLDEVGPRFSRLGFLDDASYANEPFPFGIVPLSADRPRTFRRMFSGASVQMSCTACHAAQLPDGRYSLGGANQKFDAGKFNATAVFAIWLADRKHAKPGRWDPELVKLFEEMESTKRLPKQLRTVKSLRKNPLNSLILKHIIGEDPSTLASQRAFLKAPPGVTNGFAPILNFTDKEVYIATPQIWGMGKYEPVYYGSMAGLKDMNLFIGDAIAISTQNHEFSSRRYTEPLAEYLKCMTTPVNPAPKNAPLLARGRELFAAKCATCHDLPDGSSTRAYSFEEMGTPYVYKNVLAGYVPPDRQSRRSWNAFKRLGVADKMTDRVRARRMNGIWTRTRIGTNGALEGLDHLFCLNGKNRAHRDPNDPLTQGTHADLCDEYSDADKLALKEALLHF